ncbi:hypothetical protein OOK60_10890 [Trichothermofontia sichuanensis B231]|nr:hypothetical protein [Trichothermofontia sichuanensis]UZQ53026.1 hypothetical protein OOK60_10890 [Trichothermofontia sichuanensis B231]
MSGKDWSVNPEQRALLPSSLCPLSSALSPHLPLVTCRWTHPAERSCPLP